MLKCTFINVEIYLGERLRTMLEKAKKMQKEEHDSFTAVEAKYGGKCLK